jgi:hypothetical protein
MNDRLLADVAHLKAAIPVSPGAIPTARAVSSRSGGAGGRSGGQGAGALASDQKDGLAAALARLGRAFMARDS